VNVVGPFSRGTEPSGGRVGLVRDTVTSGATCACCFSRKYGVASGADAKERNVERVHVVNSSAVSVAAGSAKRASRVPCPSRWMP